MPDNKVIAAEEFAKAQREISISEFFTKNRHLLGFDNPIRALMMTVKEAVDNSLDATTDMRVLPEIVVKIEQLSDDKFKVIVEDNGPGIVKKQIPNVFARLLYGSKFHTYRQQRGQQGIGICMTADTLVPLGDGRILPIREIVENRVQGDLFVLTPKLEFGLGKVDRFWKIPSPKFIVKLNVLGGKEINLTPENPVLIRGERGLEWKLAENIKKGEFIGVSRKLKTPLKYQKIPIFDLLDKDTRIENYEFVASILDKLRQKYGNWNSVSIKFSLDRDHISGWKKKKTRRRPTIEIIERFAHDLGMSKKEIIDNCTRVGKLGTYVNIPKYINQDFMKFLGYISGDGYSQEKIKTRWGRNIAFWNDDKILQNEFKKISAKLFGVAPKLIKHSKGRGVMIHFSSSLVARLINKCGIPSGEKFGIFRLNYFLHRKELLRPYLRAIFDCEGYVSKDRNYVSFMIRNKEMAHYIQLFLLQFEILSQINKANNDLRILITGMRNLQKFDEEISFRSPSKRRRLKSILKKTDTRYHSNIDLIPYITEQVKILINKLNISRNDLPHPHILSKSRKCFNYNTLKNTVEFFVSKVGTKKPPVELQELYCLLKSDVIWTKVKSMEISAPKGKYVYDLTMKHGNNFIANGIVVHNSAAVLYSQLTTGKPIKIMSKIDPKKPAHYYELGINTKTNDPEIFEEYDIEWEKDHGTKIELEIEAKYQKGRQSVDEYIKQIAISNPHVHITYITPEGEKIEYVRATNELPKEAKEIKPHPDGIELGILIKMLHDTSSVTVQSFLQNDFSRIGPGTAKQIVENAKLSTKKPKGLERADIENLFKSLQNARVIAPPTDCLSPIGEEILDKGLRKEINADFYVTVTRPPAVYRGFPFVIEVGLCFGGELEKESQVKLLRFANRVPLLYQQGACAITEAVTQTNWRSYGLQQSGENLPVGPAVIVVHMASVWVPFTSEAKEAVAHYDEIIKEIKLALQECGRKLYTYIKQNVKAAEQKQRIGLFEKYIPELAGSLAILSGDKKNIIEENLRKILRKNMNNLLEENGLDEDGKEAGKE